MPSIKLQEFLDELKIADLLQKIEESTSFLQKHEGFAMIAEKCCDFIENNPGQLPDTIFVELMTFIQANHSKEFSDTFCFHLLTYIFTENSLPVFTKLSAYIFKEDLIQAKRKLYNIFPDLKIPEHVYTVFRKVIFGLICQQDPLKALDFLMAYFKPDGTYGDVILNSTELAQLLEDASSKIGKPNIYKLVSDRMPSSEIFAPFEDPSFITNQLKFFIMKFEEGNGQNSINTVRSPRQAPFVKSLFSDLTAVQQGKQYVFNEAFRQYFNFFQLNTGNRELLNLAYNRSNKEIVKVISEKIGVTNFELNGAFFNIQPYEEFVDEFTYRQSPVKLRQNLIEELMRSFDRAIATHIANTCIDYLVMVYYKVYTLLDRQLLLPLSEDQKHNCIELLDNYRKSHPEIESQLLVIDSAPSHDQLITELAKKINNIEEIILLQRFYHLSAFKVSEQVKIKYKSGEEEITNFIASIPYRYHNLLIIDHSIFDATGFCFLQRELDFHLDLLSNNITDLLLRNHLDTFGLFSSLVFEGSVDTLFEKALFVHNPSSALNLQLYNENTSPLNPFIHHLITRTNVSGETKLDLVSKFEDHLFSDCIFLEDTEGKIELLNQVYQQCSSIVYNSIIESRFNGNAAEQTSRLKITPTPGDLEFWYSDEQRKAISDRNDRRSGLIRYHTQLQNEANSRVEDLLHFLPNTIGITASIMPNVSLCDFKSKKIFSVVQLFSSMSPHPWYVKNVSEVDEPLLETIYLLIKSHNNFLKKYSVDLSDLTKAGLQFIANLAKYLEDDTIIESKFLRHCQTLTDVTFWGSWNNYQAPATPVFERKIRNELFKHKLLMNKYFLSSEKEFLKTLIGPKFQLAPNSYNILLKYATKLGDMVVDAQKDAVSRFNAQFEPMLAKWNKDFFVSFTIGMGEQSYYIFTFSYEEYSIWIPMVEIKNYRFPTYN
ncbi:hypothetical protein [Sphingobacterium sp. GVS05A]|uniref:hypothetical protein n=1 Tax=Sphingobacterium sp. GVS05A TaxID=2862679 RepID=UPI001CC02DCF|nr:hypothetical protein [Sphingobacterium sp. GVS05A]